MLSRKYRLKKKSDIQQLFNSGKSVANSYLIMYHRKRETVGEPRIAFAVSKKIGKAVVRNLIKRRLREGVRPYLNQLVKDCDIIFVARAKIKGISQADVEKNIVCLLKKANLLSKTDSIN